VNNISEPNLIHFNFLVTLENIPFCQVQLTLPYFTFFGMLWAFYSCF